MSQRDSLRPSHGPETASRIFSGEAIIITPSENIVRMLNPVGSRIWELADGQRTVENIVQVLLQEYAVDEDVARGSVTAFVDQLATKGLLELSL
jgi:hypothetical protein